VISLFLENINECPLAIGSSDHPLVDIDVESQTMPRPALGNAGKESRKHLRNLEPLPRE
jgi:hypothetical protein